MPANKLFFQDWDADRFRHWAQQYGSSTAKVVDSILSSYKVVQQGYNACFGLMALAKKYSAKRLEQACQLICLRTTSPTYRQVKDILARDEDFEAVTLTVGSERKKPPIGHQRGAAYYKKEKE